MRRLLWAACFFALLAGGATLAAEVKVPSAPVFWLTDKANLLFRELIFSQLPQCFFHGI